MPRLRLTGCLVAVLFASATAAAQQAATTGSRLAAGLTPRTVMSFASPGEVRRVLELLEEGRDEEAVELASTYLRSLGSTADAAGSANLQKRYLALNAHCIALTRVGRYAEAVASCSDATALVPDRWTAWNSRGAAHYSAGNFDTALADYRRALAAAPADSPGVVAAVEQNIRLAEARLDAR